MQIESNNNIVTIAFDPEDVSWINNIDVTRKQLDAYFKNNKIDKLIIDLEAVPKLDSSGYSLLIFIRREIDSTEETPIILKNTSEVIQKTIENLGIKSFFEFQ